MAKREEENVKCAIFSKKTGKTPSFWPFFTKISQKISLIGVIAVFVLATSKAQEATGDELQLQLQTIIEDFTEFNNGGEDFDFNTLYEDLLLLSQSKINLNQATETDLARLFFLSDADIQNILSYRNSFGDFLSIYELQAVPGLSNDVLNVMKVFVEVESSIIATTKSSSFIDLEGSKDQIYVKWKSRIETPLGYQSQSGDPPRFAGDKNYMYLRYNRTTTTDQWGLILEKDPGETITNDQAEMGVDYISFHYQKNHLTRWLQQLNVGDFTVNLGQGLVSHGAFGLGKSTFTTKVKKTRPGIQRYNSVAENQSYRGIGLELGNDRSALSGIVFASYQSRDANLTGSDELGFNTFSSLPDNGLHRTIGEREDQDAIYETTVGGSIKYNSVQGIQIGLNSVLSNFNQYREFNTQPYLLYRWNGDRIFNSSVDYNLLIDGWNFFGEVAYGNFNNAFANRFRSDNDDWAQLHGVIKSLNPTFDLTLVYRNYGRAYNARFANAFGESFSANNEKGIYLGFEFRPSRKWSIRGFVDQWKNDWLRFRVDAPSTGKEYLLRIDYNEKRKKQFYIQYRLETKDENSDLELLIDRPVPRTIQRLRFHYNYRINSSIELRSRIEFSLFQKEEQEDRGIFIYQDFIRSNISSPLRITARIGYFNISDFDARIYTYENDLLYEYFIPSFSGEGLRYYINFRHRLSYNVMAELRFEQTNFFNAELISSGNNLILGNTASRIKAQIRWSF